MAVKNEGDAGHAHTAGGDVDFYHSDRPLHRLHGLVRIGYRSGGSATGQASTIVRHVDSRGQVDRTNPALLQNSDGMYGG